MSYDPAALAAITGENAYKSAPVGGQYFNAVSLGKDGKYYVTYYSQPKDQREDQKMLPSPFKATILKIRRKLSRWIKEQHTFDLKSVEYDAGATTIPTTLGDMTEKDAKAQGASVQLVLYILVGGRIVKADVSGGSLYNPNDTEDLRLYSYLQSFENEDEHTFMYETLIGSKLGTNRDGTPSQYYDMTFRRGALHTSLDEVGAAITSLPDILAENDARDLKYLGATKPKSEVDKQFDEIGKGPATANLDDVPF